MRYRFRICDAFVRQSTHTYTAFYRREEHVRPRDGTGDSGLGIDLDT